ncbi:MAG: HAD-IIB family hydrolase [Myxococcales bacterium]|nr:HAD-IIB family hydrolase [Myxococcales bacterium]
MNSYRDLDPRGIRGIVFDIDDTVTRRGILEPEAYAGMHRLASAGFELAAVTGRPLGWTDVLARQWPVRVAVGENGAGWAWVDETGTHEGYFCNEAERIEQAALLDRIRHEVATAMPHVRTTNDDRHRRCDLAFDVGESVSLARADIDALVALIEGLGARSSVSTIHAHAIPGPWDKAEGVARALREVLGIDVGRELERWVFVGDSGNDAAAFEWFPKSVGVANVREHLDRLPIPPRYVTDSDRGRGFAEIAAHLANHRD